MSEDNKRIVRRFVDAVLSKHDLAVADELLAPEFQNRTAGPFPSDREGFKQLVGAIRQTFPDLATQVEDVVAEGDQVAVRGRVTGTQRGAFIGVPATDRRATWAEMRVFRLRGGTIVEHWSVADGIALIMQLGLVPRAP
jgi:steroid delta-isomerase-like uncharacterized protein